MKTMGSWVVAPLLLVMGLVACGDDEADGAGGGGGGVATSSASAVTTTTATTTSAGGETEACRRGLIEADLIGRDADGAPAPVVWIGPGADPETGELLAADGTFVASTTYLTLESTPEAGRLFEELMAPILGDLFTSPDLVAVRLGTSASCGTARTFAVWRSLEGMMRFAAGDAHGAAVAAVGEVSRGSSVVTHWEGATIESLDWDEAAARLDAVEGPMY